MSPCAQPLFNNLFEPKFSYIGYLIKMKLDINKVQKPDTHLGF